MRTTYTLLLLAFLLSIFGCKKSETGEPLRLDIVGDGSVLFDSDGGSRSVKLETNIESIQAKVSSSASSWLSCKVSKHALTVLAAENEEETVREGMITLSGAGLSKELKVRQGGKKAYLLVSQKVIVLDEYGGESSLEVVSNKAFTVDIPKNVTWVKLLEGQDTPGQDKQIVLLSILPLTEGERTTTITIKTVVGECSESIEITQRAGKEYKPKEDIKTVDDIRVKVSRGTSSSHQPGSDIDKALDGDMKTIYHSNWDNSGSNYFPITLECFFDNADEIDYMIYYPRTEGYNGRFKEIEIFAKEGDADYRSILSKDLGGSGAPSKITFPKPLKNVQAIKIVVKSGHGDGQGFASAAELQFFKYSREKMDERTEIKRIFTDGSATEVRPEVTDDDIAGMTNPMLMQIAHHLRAGTYPSDYRIATYRAWARSSEEQSRNHTSFCLSQLDNPTGIAVRDGEKILVLVGDTHGEKISFTVVNFDKPGGDGYWEQTSYPLEEGANYLTMNRPGLAYILYNVSQWEQAKPIKVHIASGQVNGYYDGTKDSAADFVRKLNETTHPYFDVVGKRAHLVFPVSEYRAHTGSKGKELIELYDWIVDKELDFLGIYKYNRKFSNRAFFHVMYTAFMYATSYHTAYNIGTCGTILNPQNLRKDPWGTAHEQGHQFQTHGFKWHGMTEVSNNVMSLYIQTELGNASRIQEESMGGKNGFTNRYDKAYYAAYVEEKPYIMLGDVFCNLVPLWQLQLYMTKVKGNADFYKDLYEELRRTNDARGGDDRRGPGEVQLDFVRAASKAAGLDLTEFFEKWGYFRPMDEVVDDYGKRQFTITKQLADKYRKIVADLGLPKPTQLLEYVCDDNVDCFKNAATPVVTGTATREGALIIIPDGCKNAVAYEYYVGDKLCGAANNHLVRVREEGAQGAKKLYAISHDGNRREIPLD